jgi:hypothetical protein
MYGKSFSLELLRPLLRRDLHSLDRPASPKQLHFLRVNRRNHSSFVDRKGSKVVGSLAVLFAAVANYRPARPWQNEKNY